MTTLAATDPETIRFEATVERFDGTGTGTGTGLVLDHSYFYPEGGGQPADRGTIAGVPVLDVQKRDGEIIHRVDDADWDTPLEPGATVEASIDERFRTYCMRAHTASHVLYGAGRRLLSDLGYGGFGITEDKVRVDFSTTTGIDDTCLQDLERFVNQVVWDSHPVWWEELPREEALARDDIAFNTKTEEGVQGTDRIRVVTIESANHEYGQEHEHGSGPGGRNEFDSSERWDVAACGGTHVRNTREIGPVAVLGRSNPGEGLTRVEFAVGRPGIERRMTEKRVASDAARKLETGVSDVPDAIEHLQTERDDLSEELATLRDRLVEQRINELRERKIERDGLTWLVGTIDDLDANGLAARAKELSGESADVVALINDSQLAIGANEDANANALIADVTDEFGGGGGGSPTVAQGGGIGANPESVVAYLRGEGNNANENKNG
jgi:alanyl-tRNA synthetase